jgi:twinfilin-like protein
MAHSVAIPANPDLVKAFALELAQSTPTTAFFQIRIENEVLVLVHTGPQNGNMSSVFVSVQSRAREVHPCYFAVRSPSKWILVLYVPDDSKVRDKMIYAATFDSLKHELGANNFGKDIHCSTVGELSWEAVNKEEGPVHAPLTEKEIWKSLRNCWKRTHSRTLAPKPDSPSLLTKQRSQP